MASTKGSGGDDAGAAAGSKRRLCVVTGGSSGIGEAICSRFVAEGYEAICVARKRSQLEKVQSVEADLASDIGVSTAADAVLAMLAGSQAQICLVHCASNYPQDSSRE